jgi:hypothetical protein
MILPLIGRPTAITHRARDLRPITPQSSVAPLRLNIGFLSGGALSTKTPAPYGRPALHCPGAPLPPLPSLSATG